MEQNICSDYSVTNTTRCRAAPHCSSLLLSVLSLVFCSHHCCLVLSCSFFFLSFLRVAVKLPSLLSYTKLESREAIVLASKLNDFIKWLDKKAQGGALFQTEYEATEQEYMQKVTAEADA